LLPLMAISYPRIKVHRESVVLLLNTADRDGS